MPSPEDLRAAKSRQEHTRFLLGVTSAFPSGRIGVNFTRRHSFVHIHDFLKNILDLPHHHLPTQLSKAFCPFERYTLQIGNNSYAYTLANTDAGVCVWLVVGSLKVYPLYIQLITVIYLPIQASSPENILFVSIRLYNIIC